jgi:hypothetical protein
VECPIFTTVCWLAALRSTSTTLTGCELRHLTLAQRLPAELIVYVRCVLCWAGLNLDKQFGIFGKLGGTCRPPEWVFLFYADLRLTSPTPDLAIYLQDFETDRLRSPCPLHVPRNATTASLVDHPGSAHYPIFCQWRIDTPMEYIRNHLESREATGTPQ